MLLIDKPRIETMGEYKSFFSEIRETYGAPEFVVGVTFGVDLEKWRIILKELFGKEFSEKRGFEKAYLFTDKVSFIDTNTKRDLLKGYLTYKIPKVKGYLHTKFLLLKYSDKYILVVSSKNIANSGSYDVIIPFLSKKADSIKETHGKILCDYFEYLKLPEKQMKILDTLKVYDFVPIEGNWQITNFEIAYGKKRFSQELWDKISSCDFVISPFLEESMVKEVAKIAGVKNRAVKLLAYPEHIKKVKNETENAIYYYMGKVVEQKACIFQRRFHAKIYATLETEANVKKTKLYFGSANLTKEAKNRHCEMLIGLEQDGEAEEYSAILDIFSVDSDLTEIYDEKKALSTDYDTDNDQEEGAFCGPLSYTSKIYVKEIYINETSKVYELRIVNDKGEEKVWGKPYVAPVYFVEFFDAMLCIEEEIYLTDEEVRDREGALCYSDYVQRVERHLRQIRKNNDWDILTGNSTSSSGRRNDNNGQKSLKAGKIPCFYNALFQQLAMKNTADKAEISLEELSEALNTMKELLYEEETIQFIDGLLEQVENKG